MVRGEDANTWGDEGGGEGLNSETMDNVYKYVRRLHSLQLLLPYCMHRVQEALAPLVAFMSAEVYHSFPSSDIMNSHPSLHLHQSSIAHNSDSLTA